MLLPEPLLPMRAMPVAVMRFETHILECVDNDVRADVSKRPLDRFAQDHLAGSDEARCHRSGSGS